jgi:ABC-type glycerol-3-phosphate transport system permease component
MIYTGNWVGLFAAVVTVLVPSLLVYLLLSERLVEGITAGVLK